MILLNIFKGLERFGLQQTNSIELYSEEQQRDAEYQSIVEREAIYDRNYNCPVCRNKFKNKAVRSSRQRIVGVEYDLRPTYEYFEPYKYDVVLCPTCGYAALDSMFSKITPVQTKIVEQKVSAQFKAPTAEDIYDYDTSILRYKLALYVAVLKSAKSLEKAYLCLRLKWLFHMAIEDASEDPERKEKYIQQIKSISEQALTGFMDSYTKTQYNLFGFDESKLMYIIGQLNYEMGKKKEAYEWFTRVAGYTGANFRLRDMARDQRSVIKEETSKTS